MLLKGQVIKAYDKNKKITVGKIIDIQGNIVKFYKASNPKGYRYWEEELNKVLQWLKEKKYFIEPITRSKLRELNLF